MAMTQESEFDAVLDAVQTAAFAAAEADSLALHHIKNVVLLAAFACEAKRMLEGINYQLKFHPEVRSSIGELVTASDNWTCYEDVTGDVLQQVARQIDDLSEVIGGRTLSSPLKLRAAAVVAPQAVGHPAGQ